MPRRHDLSVFLDGTVSEKFSYSVGARFVGDYTDNSTSVDSANFKEDFVVFNARAAYAFNDAAEVYLRAENLLDEQYQTARGYGTAGQSFYFGVAGRF
jgi:vitamin B12 transporter